MIAVVSGKESGVMRGMRHDEAQLAAWTRTRLEWEGGVELVPILKGGSDRRYFRALCGERQAILMEYGMEREENQYFARIGRFLESIGVRVPKILAHDPVERLVWVEDVGPVDLHGARGRSWSERRALYLDALEQAGRFHRGGWEAAHSQGVPMMPGFDEALYAWERDYFYTEFVAGVCGIHLTGADRAALEAELRPGAARLLQGPPALVHRDFQSQNIMVRGGLCHLIDFQGMRAGSPYYDAASLLLDPYVVLAQEERDELLRGWQEAMPESMAEGRRLFQAAGVQRLMQALGAYGMLGLKKGKKAFLVHIDPALDRLKCLVGEESGLKVLASLLRRCRESRR
jgi:aminoglycoside/choline kinase family phosphotransferase